VTQGFVSLVIVDYEAKERNDRFAAMGDNMSAELEVGKRDLARKQQEGEELMQANMHTYTHTHTHTHTHVHTHIHTRTHTHAITH
jgi:hypothetical protein